MQQQEAGFDPLAERLVDGDPAAPRDLVERHYAELYRYAFSVLHDDRGAEDAVQDAFERALGALGRYPEDRLRAMRLRAWLYALQGVPSGSGVRRVCGVHHREGSLNGNT